MPPNNEADQQEALSTLYAGIALGALHHLKSLDLRTATILSSRGVLNSPDSQLEASLITAILSNPAHPDRVHVQPGPMLFYLSPDKKQSYSLSLSELLLSSDQKLRAATIALLNKEAKTPDTSLLNHRSVGLITKLGDRILLPQSEEWMPAAIELGDALQDDFYLNLAGVRQSLQLKFDAGVEHYLRILLRPTTTVLQSVDLLIPLPSSQQDQIKPLMEKYANEKTLISACDGYYRTLGHLPLSEPFSLGHLVRSWLTKQGTSQQIWDEVWNWADKTNSPLARYHACEVFLSQMDWVPNEKIATFCDELLNIIHAPKTDDGNNLRWTEPWKLRCELEEHYQRLLECLWPNRKSEALAVLALWLAEQVALLFGNNPEYVKHIRTNALSRDFKFSGWLWQVGRFPTEPSLLGFATSTSHSLWSISVLSQLAPALKQRVFDSMPNTNLALIEDALNASIVRSFVLRTDAGTKTTYAFERGISEPLSQFVTSFLTAEKAKQLLQFNEATVSLLAITSLKESLLTISQQQEELQTLIALATHNMGSANVLPSEAIWELVSNSEWRTEVCSKLTLLALEQLFAALSELAIRNQQTWLMLPHFFANACELASDDRERQKLLFSFVVISSMNTDSVSAVERLLKGKARQQLSEDTAVWRRMLTQLLDSAPASSATKIRAMLCVLRID